MIIVPIKNDSVTSEDSSEAFLVSSYTNMKDQPAVYLQSGDVLYFSNIESINGVRVKYNTASRMFDSLGPIKRSVEFLQPSDQIVVKVVDLESKIETDVTHDVKKLMLHDRSKLSSGLVIHTATGDVYNLGDVIQIIHNGSIIKSGVFKKKYIDYYPLA